LGTFQPLPAKIVFFPVSDDLFELIQHFPFELPEVFPCDDVYFHIPIIMFPYPYIPIVGYSIAPSKRRTVYRQVYRNLALVLSQRIGVSPEDTQNPLGDSVGASK